MDTSLQHQFAAIEGEHWWFQGRRRVVASVLRAHLDPPDNPSNRRILDVGCGTGEMVDMLCEFGVVAALDTSPEAVAYCRARFGAQFAVRVGGIPQDLPGAQTHEVATAFDVIEHLDDDRAALRGLYDVLVPGGTLVVTVPAFGFLWGAHDVLSQHRRRYTPAQLRARLVEAGFVVDRLTCFNTWLFPVVAVVRGLQRRRHAPAQSDFAMPPAPVNRLLCGLLASEAAVLRVASLPIGVSVLAVSHRPV